MDWLFGFSSNAHMQSQPWFVYTEDYKQWVKDKHPSINIYAYLDFVKARNYANRLEF
jgi:hypothetical protein